MLGWSIRARAWRSASKRAITCLVSMPGLMIFRATLRRTGCGLLGHEDDAHAAFADLLQQLVGADDRAGALGEAAHRRSRPVRRRCRRELDAGVPASRWAAQQAPRPGRAGRRRRRRPGPGRPATASGGVAARRPPGRSSSPAWVVRSWSPASIPLLTGTVRESARETSSSRKNFRDLRRGPARRRARACEPGPGVGPVAIGGCAGDRRGPRPPPRRTGRRRSGA